MNLKEAIELYIENAKVLGILEDIEESLTSSEKYTSHLEVAYALAADSILQADYQDSSKGRF